MPSCQRHHSAPPPPPPPLYTTTTTTTTTCRCTSEHPSVVYASPPSSPGSTPLFAVPAAGFAFAYPATCGQPCCPLLAAPLPPDPLCQRGDIYNMSLNGVQTTAAFKEYMGGVEDQATLKITNMFIPYDDIPNSVLCFNLRGTRDKGNCPTLYELSNPVARVEGKLEVGLYDKKAGYECCPMFAVSTGVPRRTGVGMELYDWQAVRLLDRCLG